MPAAHLTYGGSPRTTILPAGVQKVFEQVPELAQHFAKTINERQRCQHVQVTDERGAHHPAWCWQISSPTCIWIGWAPPTHQLHAPAQVRLIQSIGSRLHCTAAALPHHMQSRAGRFQRRQAIQTGPRAAHDITWLHKAMRHLQSSLSLVCGPYTSLVSSSSDGASSAARATTANASSSLTGFVPWYLIYRNGKF